MELQLKVDEAILVQYKQEFEQKLGRVRDSKRRSQLRRRGPKANPSSPVERDAADMFTRIYGANGKREQIKDQRRKLAKAREEVNSAAKRRKQ